MLHRPPADILVVDDDETNRHLLTRQLVEAGYAVRTANDGEECLAHLEEKQPALVILDVLMPKLGGFETCQRIRANARFRHMPVLLLTAVDEFDANDAALRSGADDYLPKPFRRLQLLMRVKNLLAASEEFSAMEEKLHSSERERAQQQLLTSMAVHDLKGPLAAVVSNMSFIGEAVVDEGEPAEAIRDVLRAAERMRRIIGAAVEPSERIVAAPTRMSLDEVLLQVVRAERDRQVTVRASTHDVVADRELLQRILENLLGNARKYAPSSPVFVEAERDGDDVVIRVRDEGPGIPAHERDAVFLPYQRLHGGEETDGAGLGLSFCKLAAEAHGGSIRVEENQPRGSAFVLRLPQRRFAQGVQ